jgi:hypothetical protein
VRDRQWIRDSQKLDEITKQMLWEYGKGLSELPTDETRDTFVYVSCPQTVRIGSDRGEKKWRKRKRRGEGGERGEFGRTYTKVSVERQFDISTQKLDEITKQMLWEYGKGLSELPTDETRDTFECWRDLCALRHG